MTPAEPAEFVEASSVLDAAIKYLTSDMARGGITVEDDGENHDIRVSVVHEDPDTLGLTLNDLKALRRATRIVWPFTYPEETDMAKKTDQIVVDDGHVATTIHCEGPTVILYWGKSRTIGRAIANWFSSIPEKDSTIGLDRIVMAARLHALADFLEGK